MATSAPLKPWERSPSTSGPSPFRPASGGNNTAAVVESAGVVDPGGKTSNTNVAPLNRTISARQMPPRPWERNTANNYGGYNSMANYSQYSGGVGTSSYGMNSNYGGNYGNLYRGGYGSGGAYGGGMYGGYGLGNSYGSGYSGGIYGGGYGMGMGTGTGTGMGMGMGMGGAGPLEGDPNNPFGGSPPAGPPSFWQSMLKVMYGVVTFFGRISILVDQNTQAFHFFITAFLLLCDRTGMLYGELARFVLRLLGIRTRPKSQTKAQGLPSPNQDIDEPKEAGGAWDNVWPDEGVKRSG